MQDSHNNRIRIGITHGDINGIGYELILKAFSDQRLYDKITPVFYGSSRVLNYYKKLLNIENLVCVTVKTPMEAQPRKFNVIEIVNEPPKVEVGQLNPLNGKLAIEAFKLATEHAKNGFIEGLVTLPFNKQNVTSEQYPFAGHTQYLSSVFSDSKALMFFVSEQLRIGLVTEHIPLQQVASAITKELILQKIVAIEKSLTNDFGIHKPKIGVLGLNPHAGDNSVIGNEEASEIIPGITQAKQQGVFAFGPFPACGLFATSAYTSYDAILAMYHDQGMIPFKFRTFDQGVNFTAGLPIVRTSPAHGVAFDIAGKNLASPSSFLSAIFTACDIIQHRKSHTEKKIQNK